MVYIPPTLFCQILEVTERHFPNETGGVIAGEWLSGSKWIITHITKPGPKAVHNLNSYKPDYEHDEVEIAKIFMKTNCNSVYLGDWHSHPGSPAYMSERDRKSLRSIANSKQARIPHPIMLILGTSPFQLGCWTYRRSKFFSKEFLDVSISLIIPEKIIVH